MLNGKAALVTGAGQCIGRAIAVEIARQGAAAVAVADRNGDTAAETARLVDDAGASSVAITCDLRDRDQIRAVPAGIGQQDRIAISRQQEECVAHPAIGLGEDGGREGRKVIREISEIAGAIVKGAADDKQRVVSRGRDRGSCARLPSQDFVF